MFRSFSVPSHGNFAFENNLGRKAQDPAPQMSFGYVSQKDSPIVMFNLISIKFKYQPRSGST